MNKFMIFVAGAIVGSFVTWKYMSAKYEQGYWEDEYCYDEEPIQGEKVEELKEEAKSENDWGSYKTYAKKYSNEEGDDEKPMAAKPYVITPDEFADGEYNQMTLICFADGVICYDDEEPVPGEEVEELVPENIQSHFGEYEEDTVYVRNDEQELDIEVLKDLRSFKDMD